MPGEGQKGTPQKKLLQWYISWCVFLPSSLLVCKFMKEVTKLELENSVGFPEWEDVNSCPGCPKGCSSVLLDNRTPGDVAGLAVLVEPRLGLECFDVTVWSVLWFDNVARVPRCSCLYLSFLQQGKSNHLTFSAFIAQSGKSGNISGWIKTRQWRDMSVIQKEIRIL